MDNKGLNFLVGLVALFILWKLYAIGFLHQVGFMGLSYMTGVEYNPMLVGDTPLAVLASLLIDSIAVFGSLVILVLSGFWGVMLQASTYFKDLFVTLKNNLDSFKKDIPAPKPVQPVEPVKPSEPVKEDEQKVEKVEKSPLQIIAETLKEIKDKQLELEKKVNDKVTVTKVVPEIKEEVNE